jgi:quinol monooxygenase YgiN
VRSPGSQEPRRLDQVATFGIFDAFADDSGRQAHLTGQIAAALMAKAGELLAEAPRIERVDVLAVKLTS